VANTLAYFTSSSVTKKKFNKIDYINSTRKASHGLPELAKASQGLPGLARACQGLPGLARACQGLPGLARACQGQTLWLILRFPEQQNIFLTDDRSRRETNRSSQHHRFFTRWRSSQFQKRRQRTGKIRSHLR
jgi:hypothetical protein